MRASSPRLAGSADRRKSAMRGGAPSDPQAAGPGPPARPKRHTHSCPHVRALGGSTAHPSPEAWDTAIPTGRR